MGGAMLGYRPAPAVTRPVPPSATEPPPPTAVETVEELWLTGRHLEQYRHATRLPEPYWREALRRDPGDVRTNTSLGVRLLRAGDLVGAERHLRRAIARLTRRNPNPDDGEAFYQLGLCLRLQGRLAEAEDAFAKATWDRAWQGPAVLRHRAAPWAGRRPSGCAAPRRTGARGGAETCLGVYPAGGASSPDGRSRGCLGRRDRDPGRRPARSLDARGAPSDRGRPSSQRDGRYA